MLPKDAGGPGILQNPFLNHEGSAARQALLSGLEDELDGAFELPFQLIEDAGGAKQGGGVHVVATGVHYAWFLRLIRHLIGLFDRQGVNIRAKSYHVLCRVVSLDEAHNAIVGNAVLVRNAPLLQLFGNELTGFYFFIGKFRVLVEVPADGNSFLMIGMSQFLDLFFFPRTLISGI